jgi:hypothetical protein
MQFQQMFDARSVDPSQAPAPMPAGDYKVRIIASEPKPTKDKTGGFLELTLQVLEGQFQNRELIYRLNLFNPSQQAVEIAYRQLSALCHVTGVFNIQDSQQLHGIPFIAMVVIQSGGIYNEIKGVKDLNGNVPGKAGNTGVASAMPAAAPQAAAPWGQPPQAGFPAQAPPAAAAPPWGPPALPAAAPAAAPWGPPAAAPPQAAPAPWSPPGAPPMQAPAVAAPPAWAAPPAQAQPPAAPAAAPPWAQQPQPQATAPQPPTWPPK